MAISNGVNACREACEALGIDWRTQKITRIEIIFDVRDAVRVIVHRFVEVEQMGRIDRVLRKFEFVPAPAPGPEGE